MSLTTPPFAARSAWDPPPRRSGRTREWTPPDPTPTSPTSPTPAHADNPSRSGAPSSGPYQGVPGTVLLAGITGSTAYGLATPDSDIDRLAIFATPTRELVRLTSPPDTHATQSPDLTAHEAAKYLRLVLTGNPTLLELLWLDGLTTPSGAPLWEVVEPVAARLIDLRHQLVSAPTVRNAYLGYARGQLHRITRHHPDKVGTAKAARHMARLTRQGYTLYTTGILPVRVDDPDWYEEFAARPDTWQDWFDTEVRGWERARSALVSRPNTAAAEEWLAEVRATYP